MDRNSGLRSPLSIYWSIFFFVIKGDVFITGNYCTTGNIDNFSTGNTSATNNAIIDRIESRIERITHDFFYPKDFHLFLNGNGKNALFPSIYPKFLAVNYLSIGETEDPLDSLATNSSGSSGKIGRAHVWTPVTC